MADKPFNFSAGPAILPEPVFGRAAEAVRELRGQGHAADATGIGLSILEISHRSADFTAINEGAIALCHEVIGIPETHQVFFMQGGASLQFAMIPLNLGQAGRPGAYVDTGTWSTKAIREAKTQTATLGAPKVIASSKETGFDHIPAFPDAGAYEGASYVHITTNNTIYGTEFAEIPSTGAVPLVADLSSHIGSRPMALDRVDLAYAGAQKNLGPSGVTLVAIRKSLLEALAPADSVPHFVRYRTHAEKQGLYNTPNTFGILVLKLVLEWVRDEGGPEAMAKHNAAKADKLYAALDASSLFTPHAKVGSRSQMNVCWTLGGAPEADRDALTQRFLSEASAAGMSGLKGHRSVGGLRASIYNAFPQAGIDALVSFMAEFERTA